MSAELWSRKLYFAAQKELFRAPLVSARLLPQPSWTRGRADKKTSCGQNPVHATEKLFRGRYDPRSAYFHQRRTSRLHATGGPDRQTSTSSKLEEKEKEGALPPVPEWVQRLRKRSQRPVGERILSALLSTSAASVGSYVAEPITVLHTLDPRIKQAWLIALVLLPAKGSLEVKSAVVAALLLLSITCLPTRLWKAQLKGLAILSAFLFIGVAIGSEGVAPILQPRSAPPAIEGIPPMPQVSSYRYVLLDLGLVQITRRGLKLAITTTCLSFTVLQSASLVLTTTTPEQLVASLRWFLQPLKLFRVAVEELVLRLLLALRFVGIVFDEVRNLALGVVARNVQWKSLGWLGTLDIFAGLVGRLFNNLFYHADQISQAMVARGFKGDANEHQTLLLTTFAPKAADALAMLLLIGLTTVVVKSHWRPSLL